MNFAVTMYNFILTVMGTALFAYLDGVRRSVVWASIICGATAFIVSEMLTPVLGNGFLMYFISSALTCFLGELGARLMRVPVTVILLPAIIPLVPGALLYSSMRSLMSGEAHWYTKYGNEALRATAGIGLAIVSASAVARLIHSFIGSVMNKKRRSLNVNEKRPLE